MNNKLQEIKDMITLEDQLVSQVLQIVEKFCVDNDKQKLTMWNASTLKAVLKKEMDKTISEYKQREKELKGK